MDIFFWEKECQGNLHSCSLARFVNTLPQQMLTEHIYKEKKKQEHTTKDYKSGEQKLLPFTILKAYRNPSKFLHASIPSIYGLFL